MEGFIFFIAEGREPDLIDKLSTHLTLMMRVGYDDPPYGVAPIQMCADLISRVVEGNVQYDGSLAIDVSQHEQDMLNMLCDQMVAENAKDPRKTRASLAIGILGRQDKEMPKDSISTKPGQVKSVYLAGRIDHTDWRHDIAENLRGAVINADPQLDEPLRTELRPTMRVQGGPTHISGPYFISCDHGGFHGPGSHGVGADYSESRCCPFEMVYPNPRTFAVRRCMTWLRDADAMYVWAGPDLEQAHGTHVEMGVAHALGIPIFAAVASDTGEHIQLETWFALELARSFPASDPVDGFLLFSHMVAKKRGGEL